jgi:hypothetical protein
MEKIPQIRDYKKSFVYSELIKKGFLVSKNPKNDKRFHILCRNADNTKSVKIRVAQSSHSMRIWTLNVVDEYYSDNLFYVFVGHKSLKNQEFLVIPSKVVSEYIIKNADLWLSTKRKDGEPHKNINTRKFVIGADESKKYLNNWKLLGLD